MLNAGTVGDSGTSGSRKKREHQWPFVCAQRARMLCPRWCWCPLPAVVLRPRAMAAFISFVSAVKAGSGAATAIRSASKTVRHAAATCGGRLGGGIEKRVRGLVFVCSVWGAPLFTVPA